jgi:hypothetical protein
MVIDVESCFRSSCPFLLFDGNKNGLYEEPWRGGDSIGLELYCGQNRARDVLFGLLEQKRGKWYLSI